MADANTADTSFKAYVRRLLPAPVLTAKRQLGLRIDLAVSVARLRRLPRSCAPAEAYSLAFQWRGRGAFASIQPLQNQPEIVGLIELLKGEGARHIAEIGSFLGGSLFIMTRTLGPALELVSVDWPEADPLLRTDRLRRRLHESFAGADQTIKVIYGNSQEDSTLEEFAAVVPEGSLDCLLIDADHSAAGVRSDFDRYRKFVRPGGVIVFHDIVPHDTMPFGVADFWRELSARGRSFEIVEPNGWERRRGGGIGVWWNSGQ